MKAIATLGALLTLPLSGAVISYQYDAAGRLIGVNYGGNASTTYSRDRNGSQLARATISAPLPPLAGKFTGLVSNADPALANTAAVSLVLLPGGGFSGQLLFGGKSTAFKGAFANDGTTDAITIPRKSPLPPLTLSLVLDVSGGTMAITGTLTDGTFTSEVFLERSTFDKKRNPVPLGITGAYTILVKPSEAIGPQGFGFGTARLDAVGIIRLAATLPDGSKIAHSGVLSSEGRWPLYLPLYKKGGLLAGSVLFATAPGESDFSGRLTWQKPQTSGALYPSPIDTELDLIGSKYVVPRKGQRVVDFAATPENAELEILGAAPLSRAVTLDAANKIIVAPGIEQLKLKLSLASGLLSGSYKEGGRLLKLGGVIFQRSDSGAGMVISPTETAPFTLADP